MASKEQAEVAARWWREVLFNPMFDNGDDSLAGMQTMMMAEMAAWGDFPSAEQLDKFEEILRGAIIEKNVEYLAADYGPGLHLAEAMQDAGISFNRCPWKTVMWINDDGTVSVAYGYGAPVVNLEMDEYDGQ